MNIDTGTPKMLARKEGGIGWMTFNQPEKRNAVAPAMWDALTEFFVRANADPEVRAGIFTGEGLRRDDHPARRAQGGARDPQGQPIGARGLSSWGASD